MVEREARADDLGAHALELLADRHRGMPVGYASAACALGALRPPLIIGGRTSGGASASGSVSSPVARYQVYAASPGTSPAVTYVREATTTPPERGIGRRVCCRSKGSASGWGQWRKTRSS